MNKMRKILSIALAVISINFTALPVTMAASPIEASVYGNSIAIRGTAQKSQSADNFEVKDSECDYIALAIFDLSLMLPITDATIMRLSNEQRKNATVTFEATLQLIDGYSIDTEDPERYVLMGTFEKEATFLTTQKSGSQFSSKISFGEFESDQTGNEMLVQINRLGYIAQNDVVLKAGPNDDLPAVGKDGLYIKLSKDTEVDVLYKGRYTYKVEYDGRQYYTELDNIYFKSENEADILADRIRKIIYEQSMLADYYAYGVSQFDFSIVEGEDLSSIIELTREQLMAGSESVYEAVKEILKKEKSNGVTKGEIAESYLDAVIEEDPLRVIGEAANDLYSQGLTKATQEREEAISSKVGNQEQNIQKYELEHADDIVRIEIDKNAVGRLLGKVWDDHLSDEVINSPEDEYGLDIAEKIYQNILGWDNRMPRNYSKLIECYTGTPDGLTGFDVQGDVNLGNEYANIKGNISQHEMIRKYGKRLSEKMQEYIRNGKFNCLPFNCQTKNVSMFNRFLPGSLVIFEVIDSRVLSVSQKQYLGVYVGNGEFYLPGFSDSVFDTLCEKIDGIERVGGLIKITQNKSTSPFNKNASYGFLWLCHRNISVKNVYEADISLLNDPQYIAADDSYFPMSALRMSQIKYKEMEWQIENGWRPPKVWDE